MNGLLPHILPLAATVHQKMKGVMTIHFSSSGSQLSSRAVRNSQPCSLSIALDLNDEQVDITSYNYGNLEDWL